jgi:hypothetical protein
MAAPRHGFNTDKSFCFFFQKEALVLFWKKRTEKLLSVWLAA